MEDGPSPNNAVAFGCIMAVGLPLNALSLWILVRHHGLKSPSAVFMVNLAFSDLLVIISLPWRVYFNAKGTWPLNEEACAWISMFFRNNIRSSCTFITFISVDRLLAVVYPLRSQHLRTSSNACKAAGLIWLLAIVFHIPETMRFSGLLHTCNVTTCFAFNPCVYDDGIQTVRIYIQSVLVLTMLAVNVVCTALVSWTLRKHLKESAKVNNKVNVMLIFVMNLVTFAVCFLPVTIDLLIRKRSYMILTCLATLNCCMDPLLYYFTLDSFWKKKEDKALARKP